jgi:hypothetical protein
VHPETSEGEMSAPEVPDQKRLTFGSTERNGIVLSVDSRRLTLCTSDYHCPPAHIGLDELRRLGFVLLTVGRKLPPSAALAWRHSGREPRGEVPDGLQLDGYVLARVRAGLDVFVISYAAGEVLVGEDGLRQVGLRVRRTPFRGRRAKGGDAGQEGSAQASVASEANRRGGG